MSHTIDNAEFDSNFVQETSRIPYSVYTLYYKEINIEVIKWIM